MLDTVKKLRDVHTGAADQVPQYEARLAELAKRRASADAALPSHFPRGPLAAEIFRAGGPGLQAGLALHRDIIDGLGSIVGTPPDGGPLIDREPRRGASIFRSYNKWHEPYKKGFNACS